MFRKLLKHEFRATGRFMWILYAGMLMLSLGSHFAIGYQIDEQGGYGVLGAIAILVAVLWALSLMFGVAMTVVLMVHRFYKNYLTDEGYLMFTLPAGVTKLTLSKLFVAVVWGVATILVSTLGIGVALMDSGVFEEMSEAMQEIRQFLPVNPWDINFAVIAVELVVLGIVSLTSTILHFYAAMAIGYSFNRHKVLLSVAFYFAINVVFQIFSGILSMFVGDWNGVLSGGVEEMMLAGLVVGNLLKGIILYGVTVFSLRKRLNLS